MCNENHYQRTGSKSHRVVFFYVYHHILQSSNVVKWIRKSYFIFQTSKQQTEADLVIHDRSESVPSRATDVPSSTLKDSGYGDVANESSRNISPEDYQPLKPPHFGGGGLLKTITDGLEEEASSRDRTPNGETGYQRERERERQRARVNF